MITSAVRLVVNLKVTLIHMCGSLASTVSNSESDDVDYAVLFRKLVRPNR